MTVPDVIPMPEQTCEVCGQDGNDRRTVAIDMLYDLTEAGLRELPRTSGAPRRYGARVCKDCRGDLIGLLRLWRQGKMRNRVDDPAPDVDAVGNERNIPVRQDGRTVMLSLSEYETWRSTR